MGFGTFPAIENAIWEWFKIQLGITRHEQWYRVTHGDFASHQGSSLLCNNQSYLEPIMNFVSDYDWKEWLFPKVPDGFWQCSDNRVRYMNWLGKRLGYRKPEDWYSVSQAIFYQNGGAGILHEFGDILQDVVKDYLPSYEWQPWLFHCVNKGHWESRINRLFYLRWLEKKLGYKRPEDWYRVRSRDFIVNRGSSLLLWAKHYPPNVLKELYPGYQWRAWQFHQVSKGFWTKRANRLEYLHWLGDKLGFETIEDWLNLERLHFENNLGIYLINKIYKGDRRKPLKELFPGQDVQHWMLRRAPQGFWDQQANRTAYLRWLGKQLNLKTNEDWYSLTVEQVCNHHGGGFLHEVKSVMAAVREAFPHRKLHPWCFPRVPVGYWKDRKNREQYFDWFAKQLAIKTKLDWERVTKATACSLKASSLIKTQFNSDFDAFIVAARHRWQSTTVKKKKR